MISWKYDCNVVHNFALDHWDLYSSISGMNNTNTKNQLSMKREDKRTEYEKNIQI